VLQLGFGAKYQIGSKGSEVPSILGEKRGFWVRSDGSRLAAPPRITPPLIRVIYPWQLRWWVYILEFL
jgi:hypothetical protein